jgi:hypothetical protein
MAPDIVFKAKDREKEITKFKLHLEDARISREDLGELGHRKGIETMLQGMSFWL